MKKIITLLSLLALVLSSCEHEMYEPSDLKGEKAAQFTAETEIFGDVTKTSLNSNRSVVWSAGDLLSIFQGSSIADKYKVSDASEGNANASFSIVKEQTGVDGDFVGGTEVVFDTNIAVYPYESDMECAPAYDGDEIVTYKIKNVTFPAAQTYAPNSFPDDAFVMTAITSGMTDHTLKFKNVCGALKLQLKGTSMVKSITLKGNSDEKLSGDAVVSVYPDGSFPTLNFANNATNTITLDCGNGVQLNSGQATAFIIAVPPVGFENGFTVTVTDLDGDKAELSTNKANPIVRSKITTMPELSVEIVKYANNKIYYKATEKIDFAKSYSDVDLFGVQIESNEWNSDAKEGVVTFKDDVTKIDTKVLHGFQSKIISLRLPETINEIGEAAFKNCEILEYVNIPSNVTEIKGNTFYGSGIKSINLHSGVTTIQSGSFYECENLKSVGGVSESLVYIGQSAFYGCVGLENIQLPNSEMLDVESNAFIGCTSLPVIDDCRYVSFILVEALNNKESYNIKEGTRIIGSNAFSANKNLTSLEFLPNTIIKIGSSAFSACHNLVDITLPSSVKEIGDNAFRACWGLTCIDNLPEGIEKIGRYAFSGCKNLEKVVLPNSVTVVEAFSECTSLTSVSLGNRTNEIGAHAFNGCNALTNITLPASVEKIGAGAFIKCSNLKYIYIEAIQPPAVSYNAGINAAIPSSFPITNEGFTIYVPSSAVDNYINVKGLDFNKPGVGNWSGYTEYIKGI